MFFLSPFSRGGESRDVEKMANPEWVDEVNLFRAKAGEPYQNFDGGGFHRNQLSPLPKIGEGFREWSEASSYGKKRLEMLR